MGRELYTTRLVIASLANVPSKGYEVAAKNAAAVFAQQPELLVVTETWDPAVKRAFRDAAPRGWSWHTEPGQSVMVGCGGPWHFGIETTLRGAAAPRIPLVNDRRDVPLIVPRYGRTARRIQLGGVHTGPIPTRKAPWKVPAAKAGQALARRRLSRYARRHGGYPLILAGDWNNQRLLNPDLRPGPGITHAECFDGRSAVFGEFKSRTFALRSDHPGIVIDLTLEAP